MSFQRCLRSKHLRALIWRAAGGKCCRCGRELHENFHADHVVPYAVVRTTNIHNMQALCPACNWSKGSQIVELRSFQKAFLNVVTKIATKRSIRYVWVHVTPGGGKSLLALLVAYRLILDGLIDKICWVVPRTALAEQGEKVFHNPVWRRVLGHNLSIRTSVNDINPSRETDGYAITMAALTQDRGGINLDEFKRYRYALIIDEAHHIAADGDRGYRLAIEPLIDEAKYTFYLTGTLERHRSNGESGRIFGMKYRKNPDGLYMPDLEDDSSSDTRAICFARKDALRERAIIPIHIRYHDARAQWVDMNGNLKECDSFDGADEDEESAMRRVVLKTEYAYQVIDEAVHDWLNYRRQVYGNAKLLVVAPSQKEAKKYFDYIQKKGVETALAISEDSESAALEIRKFRDAKVNGKCCLVTVAMAYEGLDVPEITHIVGLTDYRSKPWVEQMVARATRFNPDPMAGSWEQQVAYIYVPNDGSMKTILNEIKQEQIPIVGEIPDEYSSSESSFDPDFSRDYPRQDLVAKSSEMTRTWASDLDGDSQTTYDEDVQLKAIISEVGLPSTTTTTQLKAALKMARALDLFDACKPIHPSVNRSQQSDTFIPNEVRRQQLRDALKERCLHRDKRLGAPEKCAWGTTNTALKLHYGISRKHMTIPQLETANKEFDDICPLPEGNS